VTCSGIPQDPPKSVVVRGDCHAVRHAVALTMIMTIDGALPRERPVPQARWQCPPRPAPPRRTTSTPPASPSRPGAPATPADSAGDPDIVTEQDHRPRRGPVDQTLTAPFIHSAPIIYGHQPTRQLLHHDRRSVSVVAVLLGGEPPGAASVTRCDSVMIWPLRCALGMTCPSWLPAPAWPTSWPDQKHVRPKA
jgi:hypothetical protein